LISGLETPSVKNIFKVWDDYVFPNYERDHELDANDAPTDSEAPVSDPTRDRDYILAKMTKTHLSIEDSSDDSDAENGDLPPMDNAGTSQCEPNHPLYSYWNPPDPITEVSEGELDDCELAHDKSDAPVSQSIIPPISSSIPSSVRISAPRSARASMRASLSAVTSAVYSANSQLPETNPERLPDQTRSFPYLASSSTLPGPDVDADTHNQPAAPAAPATRRASTRTKSTNSVTVPAPARAPRGRGRATGK
jgi:hypothetical protein